MSSGFIHKTGFTQIFLRKLEEQERNAREEKLEEDRKRLESEKASFWVKPESCHVTFAAP